MSDFFSSAKLGRTYLETYYPSRFDEEAFHAVLMAIDAQSRSENSMLDVEALSARYGLASAVVENASILFHLSNIASMVAEAWVGRNISVLDVGGGPTMYQHIPVSLIADAIIHAEPLKENRAEVLQYLRREPGAYDWSAYFRAVKRYVGQNKRFPVPSQKLAEISSALPRSTDLSFEEAWRILVIDLIGTRVVPCDAFSPDLEYGGGNDVQRALSDAGAIEGASLVESNFLLESSTDSIEEWQAGLGTLMQKVAPGGFLSMMAIRNARWYLSGIEKVPAVAVDEVFLQKEFERRSFSLSQVRVLKGSDQKTFGYDGMVFILARKNMS